VKEALGQNESMGQIARQHQVSEVLIYRCRGEFFEGNKAALTFARRNGSHAEKAALECQVKVFRN